MKKIYVCIALLVVVLITSSISVFAAPAIFKPTSIPKLTVNSLLTKDPAATAKRGFITEIQEVNSKEAVFLNSWGGTVTSECQQFGYLKRTYLSYFYDRPIGNTITVDKSQNLPFPIGVDIGKVIQTTATVNVTGSVGGDIKVITLNTGVDSSLSVSSTQSINQPVPYEAKLYGIWQVSGYWVYETKEYDAYQVILDKKQNKFVIKKDNYKLYIHTPVCYTLLPDPIRIFK